LLRLRDSSGTAKLLAVSYDLVFWKQKPSCTTRPQTVYDALMDERPVKGLVVIPVVEMVRVIGRHFPGTAPNGSHGYFWDGGKRGAFELYASDYCLTFSCHQMGGGDMNAIIDAALTFDCPLYDPQVDKRFAPKAKKTKTAKRGR
jgi:hypothetical protein